MTTGNENYTEALSGVLSDSRLTGAIGVGYRGSLAHGVYDAESGTDDIDLMAVCAPNENYYLGLSNFGSRGTVEIKHGDFDVVAYELRKFVSLLAKGNPNVLSFLWMKPIDFLLMTSSFSYLIKGREVFSGKHSYPAFYEYAKSQMKRMMNPSDRGFQGEKRRVRYEQFGYDCKSASHVVRLLRMGIEYFQTGELIVERPDAAELLEIKRGGWLLKRVEFEVGILFRALETAYVMSKLPERPNLEKINALCVKVVKESLGIVV